MTWLVPAFLGGIFKRRASRQPTQDPRYAVMTWEDSLSVHVDEIDEQHKVLVELINELNEAMQRGRDRTAVGSVLASLIEYTKTHFSFEEKVMVTHNYPAYQRHKSEHDKLTAKVLDLQRDYRAGSAEMSDEVMRFLRSWLVGHIQGMDKSFGAFLNSHASNTSEPTPAR